MSRTVLWKLTAGNHTFQETEIEKRKKGEEYIARLKSDGEKVLNVKEENGYLVITLE
jgi:hypothetical protein